MGGSADSELLDQGKQAELASILERFGSLVFWVKMPRDV